MNREHRLPIVNIAPLVGAGDRHKAGAAIDAACRDLGFFYVANHGVSEATIAALADDSRTFFALPDDRKSEIAMAHGGRAWRGYFPVGGELTSGKPDLKEGIYFGEELGPDDARVKADWPLHGRNLFPAYPDQLKAAVLEFMTEAEQAAHAILRGVALGLGLDEDYFWAIYTAHPTLLCRIFHYPPTTPSDESWGVGEHTDYGLPTLLAQDDVGGRSGRSSHCRNHCRPDRFAGLHRGGAVVRNVAGVSWHSTIGSLLRHIADFSLLRGDRLDIAFRRRRPSTRCCRHIGDAGGR